MRGLRVWRLVLALGLVVAGAVTGAGAASANVNNVECDGQTLVGSYANVLVSGNGCTLDGASVAGWVLAEGASGTVMVKDSTVFGGVSLKDSSHLALVGSIIVGEVSVEKGRSVALDGGILEGGLKVIESQGDVLIAGAVPASIVIAKGVGNVEVLGGEPGDSARRSVEDLIVVGQHGDVTVRHAGLSDVTLTANNGSVSLDDVVTDSDTKIVLNEDVTIERSILGSDVAIIENRAVTLRGNDFSLEDVLIGKNSGPVIVDGNTDFSLNVIENVAVTISDNVFTDADVSKNSGGTTISGKLRRSAEVL